MLTKHGRGVFRHLLFLAFVLFHVSCSYENDTEREIPPLDDALAKMLGDVEREIKSMLQQRVVTSDTEDIEQKIESLKQHCLNTDCNAHELSLVYRSQGMLAVVNRDIELLEASYNQVIEQSPNIPVALELEALKALAQVSAEKDAYEKSLDYLDQYAKLNGAIAMPKLEKFVRAKQHYHHGELVESLKLVHQLIVRAQKAGERGRYEWALLRGKVYREALEKHGLSHLYEMVFKEHDNDDYMPISKTGAIYPEHAAKNGIEGTCTSIYTVNEEGFTEDIKILECSDNIFEAVSIESTQQFVYKPRYVEDRPVRVEGVRNRFTFKMSQ